jgi:hypothetical protein
MSKKHFIALAQFIMDHNKYRPESDRFTPLQLDVLASFCKSQNSAFMRDRWLDYIAGVCGPNGGAR